MTAPSSDFFGFFVFDRQIVLCRVLQLTRTTPTVNPLAKLGSRERRGRLLAPFC